MARADWQQLIMLFMLSRVLLSIGIGLAYLANTSRLEVGLDDLFCNWDCDWYVGIAEHGYQQLHEVGASGAANWAFFPALPMTMWGVSQVTGLPAVYAGMAIAEIGWATGLYFLFLAARDLGGPVFARHAAIVYALWPFAVHASIPMTEALFVPTTIGAFLFARRGDWLLAAMLAAVASATKTVGVVLMIPFFVLAASEYGLWRLMSVRPGTERAVVAVGACGLGVAGYMIYLYGLTGDALAFSHNQVAWSRVFELPWMMILDELNPAFINPGWLIANALDLATGLAAVGLAVYLWRRGRRAEALFAGVTLLIAFDTGNASSLPRYSGGLYPVMLAVMLMTARPLRQPPTYAVCAAAQVCFSVAWGLEQFYVM